MVQKLFIFLPVYLTGGSSRVSLGVFFVYWALEISAYKMLSIIKNS